MIRRVRRPDGTNNDVDMGPGPVGQMSAPGYARRIFGAPIAQSDDRPVADGRRRDRKR